MKYTNFLSNLGRFLLVVFMFIVLALPIPAGIVVFLILNIPIAYAITPMLLALYPIMLNWFLGYACGAKFYNTGYVRKGRSIRDIVKDERYYKRAIYVNFIIMALFIPLAIYFSFSLSCEYFGWSVLGLVESIIGTIIYFLFAMSAIEKSGVSKKEKRVFAEKIKNQSQIQNEVKKTKFNFEKYPEMKEVYFSYKDNKNRAIRLKGDGLMLEEYNQACSKRDEKFEELSRAMCEKFNDIEPDLIDKKTNEKIKWKDLFNVPFEKLTKNQKDLMIRLLDAYPYKFKESKIFSLTVSSSIK
jgi:hypothetical protein